MDPSGSAKREKDRGIGVSGFYSCRVVRPAVPWVIELEFLVASGITKPRYEGDSLEWWMAHLAPSSRDLLNLSERELD